MVEAIEARPEAGKRIVEQLGVIDTFSDSRIAMSAYAQPHRQSPERELYVLHTDRETLDINERRWLRIRGAEPVKASALEVPIESR